MPLNLLNPRFALSGQTSKSLHAFSTLKAFISGFDLTIKIPSTYSWITYLNVFPGAQ